MIFASGGVFFTVGGRFDFPVCHSPYTYSYGSIPIRVQGLGLRARVKGGLRVGGGVWVKFEHRTTWFVPWSSVTDLDPALYGYIMWSKSARGTIQNY